MCATLVDRGETVLLRSYNPPSDSGPAFALSRTANAEITISNASRATSAAPTYLPEKNIGGNTFWDGGMLNNNPIDQVWNARYDLAPTIKSTPVIKVVLSLGCSFTTATPKTTHSIFHTLDTVQKVIAFVTNTEAKHRDFECNIRKWNNRQRKDEETKYFRFNAPTGDRVFRLDEYAKMGDLADLTRQWLRKANQREKIRRCADLLRR
jgi:predicted acylesterase/phospholipase RssA